MTLADLLKLADSVWHNRIDDDSDSAQLATAISNLLTAETCGWERPEVGAFETFPPQPFVEVPASWAACVSPADARVMAVMLLQAADEAEGQDQ